MLQFIFTLEKVKTQVQTQLSKPLLQLSWTTAGHFPHFDLFSFVTRDNDKNPRIVVQAQNIAICK